LQDKRYLLIGIIFAEEYHYSLIFVDNRNGVVGSNNIFYDGRATPKVEVFARDHNMPHPIRGLVYTLDPQSVNENPAGKSTEQEERGLTSPHAMAAEKKATDEDVTATAKRLTVESDRRLLKWQLRKVHVNFK
jgi:hypothetical protein